MNRNGKGEIEVCKIYDQEKDRINNLSEFNKNTDTKIGYCLNMDTSWVFLTSGGGNLY